MAQQEVMDRARVLMRKRTAKSISCTSHDAPSKLLVQIEVGGRYHPVSSSGQSPKAGSKDWYCPLNSGREHELLGLQCHSCMVG